ncbi:hypothetical protein JCM8115_000368 [Rhodotorula mucilaginosa]
MDETSMRKLKRSVGTSAGAEIRAWVNRQSANTVLGITMGIIFLVLLVVIAVVWECVRKCRTSARAHRRNHNEGQWQNLEDGSSVLISSDGRPITRLGPMASLLRSDNGRNDGGANLAGIGTYQPARTGATPEMRADAHGMSGRFAPYDPPATVTAFRYPPPGPVPTPESRSIRTHDSGLSGETKVASVYGSEKKEGEQDFAKLQHTIAPGNLVSDTTSSTTTTPDVKQAQVAYPVEQFPRPVSLSTISSTIPISAGTPSTAVWILPPRPEAPTPPSTASANASASILGSHGRSASLGEMAFSTPKVGSPLSGNASKAPDHSRGHGHQRGASFTARPLALSSSLSSSAVPALVSDSPPKIELRRNWSIGTWIPQLTRSSSDDKGKFAALAGGNEQERAGLVHGAGSG